MGWRTSSICVLLLGAVACGTDGAAEKPLQVSVMATRDGEPLEVHESGLAELGHDVEAYAIFVRLGRLTLRVGEQEYSTDSPHSVDLISGATLIEAELRSDATPTEVRIEIPEPEPNRGVRGNGAAVFIGGLLSDTPFEYSDRSMAAIRVEAAGVAPKMLVRFEVEDWFEDVEASDLDEQGETFLIDADHNAAAATEIEEQIRDSVQIDCNCEAEESHAAPQGRALAQPEP